MFGKTYHATHPDMMDGASNDAAARALPDRAACSSPDAVALNYSHYERFVIGGAAPVDAAVALPAQTEPASAAGKPFLERRELGVVNVGDGAGTRHGRRHGLRAAAADGLYVPMGSAEVAFASTDAGQAGELLPGLDAGARALRGRAHLDRQGRAAGARRAGDLERAHDLPVHRAGDLQSCQLLLGLTVLKTGQRLEHHAAAPARPPLARSISTSTWATTSASSTSWASRTTCATSWSPTRRRWCRRRGRSTWARARSNYCFIWAMGGENLDYTDMNQLDICQLK